MTSSVEYLHIYNQQLLWLLQAVYLIYINYLLPLGLVRVLLLSGLHSFSLFFLICPKYALPPLFLILFLFFHFINLFLTNTMIILWIILDNTIFICIKSLSIFFFFCIKSLSIFIHIKSLLLSIFFCIKSLSIFIHIKSLLLSIFFLHQLASLAFYCYLHQAALAFYCYLHQAALAFYLYYYQVLLFLI